MKAPRLPEVTARVVAWHNRHPLARRIDPTQVHSIGEVRLPFASRHPWGALGAEDTTAPAMAAPAAAAGTDGHMPTLAEALAQRSARHQPPPAPGDGGADGHDAPSLPPGDDLLPPKPDAGAAADGDIDLALDAPAQATDGAPDEHDGEAALLVPLLDGGETAPAAADLAADLEADTPTNAPTDAPTDTPTDAAGATGTADPGTQAAPIAPIDAADPPHPAGGTAAPDAARPMAEAPEVYPPTHGNVPTSALARAVERRAAARGTSPAGGHADGPASADDRRPGRWRRLVAAVRLAFSGRQPGLPPLRAAFNQDFAWPLRPGQVARWAQRHGRAHPLAPPDWPRRHVDADGARLATLRQKGLAHDIPLHVLTAAIGVGDRRIRLLLGADGSVLGPRAYSRARVGSAAALLAAGLVAVGWTLRPLHGSGMDGGGAALAALAASAASAPAAAAAAAAADLAGSAAVAGQAASEAPLAATASPPDHAASDAPAAHAEAPATDTSHTETAAAQADDAASQPQASIRPVLTDEAKHAAKVASAKLRGEPPPPEAVQGPVYAVVSLPSRQREAAAGHLALMKSTAARLSSPTPDHGELLERQGQWRAAWWPFASLVDAERARVLLLGKGLKAEVVEF